MTSNLKITVQTLDDYASANAVAGASASSNNGPPTDANSFENAIRTIESKRSNRIVIVDGVIDPSNLRDLAIRSGLDKRLLDPSRSAIRSSMLPSRPLDFLVARFITVGRYVDGGGGPKQYARNLVARKMAEYDAEIAAGCLNGFVRTRGVKFYGQDYFTVEQQTVFLELPTPAAGKWSALLLNDAGGRPTNQPPWSTSTSREGNAKFLPIMVRDFTPGHNVGNGAHGATTLPNRPNPFDTQHIDRTSHPPLVTAGNEHTSSLDFAANLLTTSALSWSQFLAFLRSNLFQQLPEEEAVGPPSDNDNNITEESLRLLHQARAHLANAVDYFDDVLQFCKTAGRENKIQALPSGPLPAQLSLVCYDFEQLRARALNVSARCKEDIDAIRSKIALQQSQEALRGGERMALVTYLGVAYAALALSSSIFGMNVKGIDDIDWYYFVALSVGIGLLTGVCLFIYVIYVRCGARIASKVK